MLVEGEGEEEEHGEDQTEERGSQHLGHHLGGMTVLQLGNNREGEGEHLVLGLIKEVLGIVNMVGTVTAEDMAHMSPMVLIVGGGEGIKGSGEVETAGLTRGGDSE